MKSTHNIQLTVPGRHLIRREKLYTLKKEWTERFRRYVKRIEKIDIKQLPTDKTAPTCGGWNENNEKSDKILFGALDR